jgi:hypothetical protein
MSPDDSTPQREPAEPGAEAAVPPMPVVIVTEIRPGTPFTLTKGRYTIGWEWRTEKWGGPCFATLRRSALGVYKEINCYPLTDEGWRQAWQEITDLDPATAQQARHVLAQRADKEAAALERQRLQASSLGHLGGVIYLGGYVPGAELAAGKPYDVRFLQDRVAIHPPHDLKALADVPYVEVATVDIGDPASPKPAAGSWAVASVQPERRKGWPSRQC